LEVSVLAKLMENAQFHGIVAASSLGASLLMPVKDDQIMNEVHTKIPLSAPS
jgi:hypothetical protein